MNQIVATDRVSLALSLFDAFAAGDLGRWQERLAADFTFSYPGMPDGRGIDAARAYNAPFTAAFADWKIEVRNSAVSGETVFAEITINATHKGALATPAGTLPATGRRCRVECVLVSRQRGGRILRESTYWNVPDLLAQIA